MSVGATATPLPGRQLKTPYQLASLVKNKVCEKFDPLLSDDLLSLSYASGNIAVAETSDAIGQIVTTHARFASPQKS